MHIPMPFQRELTTDSRASGFGSRFFNRIEIGPFSLSVQGSQYSYSTPRENLPATEYTEMEIALFIRDRRGETEHWVLPHLHRGALGKWAERLNFEEGETSVAGYVPVEDIQALINYLKSRARDGRFVGSVRRTATAKPRKRGTPLFHRVPKKAVEHRRRLAKAGMPWSMYG